MIWRAQYKLLEIELWLQTLDRSWLPQADAEYKSVFLPRLAENVVGYIYKADGAQVDGAKLPPPA
jgi:hypothetical protein